MALVMLLRRDCQTSVGMAMADMTSNAEESWAGVGGWA